MVDINEIRARNAKLMADMQKRTEEAVSKLEMPAQDENADSAEEERARRAAELAAANEQRQREVLSQMMGEEFARQTAAMQEMVSQEVQRQAASAAAQLQQDALGALFGDDAALFSAALNTLAQTENDEDAEEEEQRGHRPRPCVRAALQRQIRRRFSLRLGHLPCGNDHTLGLFRGLTDAGGGGAAPLRHGTSRRQRALGLEGICALLPVRRRVLEGSLRGI